MSPINTITITGFVLNRDTQLPVSDLRVEVWDNDLIFDDLVGSANTDSSGAFSITFTRKYFRELFLDRKPDLYFRVYQDKDKVLDTKKDTLWNEKAMDPVTLLVDVPGTEAVTAGKTPVSGNATVTGKVVHSKGNPIPGLPVHVMMKTLTGASSVGTALTDAAGIYTIAPTLIANKVYLVEVRSAQGAVLAKTGQQYGLEAQSVFDFELDLPQYKGSPQFSQLNTAIGPYQAQLQQVGTLKVDHILLMAHETKRSAKEVWHGVQAAKLSTQNGIPAAAYFGWFKAGLPTNLKALFSTPFPVLEEALNSAIAANHIDGTQLQVPQVMATWKQKAADFILQTPAEGSTATLGNLIGIVVPGITQQRQIMGAYINHIGNPAAFWNEMGQSNIAPNLKEKLQKLLQLSAVLGNQIAMVTSVFNQAGGIGQGASIKSLAGKTKAEWEQIIASVSQQSGTLAVPSTVPGNDDPTKIKNYAAAITDLLAVEFPTAAFFGKLQGGSNNAFTTVQPDLLTFYNNNPDFEFGIQSAKDLIADDSPYVFTGIQDQPVLLETLFTVQRINNYSIDYEVMCDMYVKGYTSAVEIVSVSCETFTTSMNTTVESAEATEMYMLAQTTYMNSASVYAYVNPSLNLSTNVTATTISATADPTLRTMFGSLDACQCEHCMSVFSPAAYFTDILNFLNTYTPEVYEELERRRPDLVHLLLSCENTHTPMPYVDLVIELLENIALQRGGFAVPDTYQTTWEAPELAANPEHLNIDAYTQLAAAVYPQPLPFNFALEEARHYLKHLGIPRHAIMTRFYEDKVEFAFDDFDIAMERIGITPEQANILIGTTTGDGGATSGLWNFYGFDKSSAYAPITDPADSSLLISSGTWVETLADRVDVFLQQTQLEYRELLTLLLCDFINPLDSSNTRTILIVAKETDANGDPVDPATCELDLLELQGLDETALGKIHRFLMLWRKLGWTMYELDLAIQSLNESSISETLKQISQAEYLRKDLKLSVGQVLSLWADIDTAALYRDWYRDNYPYIQSLYGKLFQNKTVLNPVDPAFEDVTTLTGSMDDHTASIFAALQIDETSYQYLIADTSVVEDTDLTLANLSSLHRNVTLYKRLKLPVLDFLALKELSGIADPFESPNHTYLFLHIAEQVRNSGFKIAQIDYLLRHEYLEETATAPTDDTIGVFLSEVRSGLRAIRDSDQSELESTLAQKFSEKLKVTSTVATLLLQTYSKSCLDNTTAIQDDFLVDFDTSEFLMSYFDASLVEYEPVLVREEDADATTQVAVENLYDDFMRLEKAAFVINKLKLTDNQVAYVLDHFATMGCVDFANLQPEFSTTAARSLESFLVLVRFAVARDLLPVGTPEIEELVDNAVTSADPALAKEAWLSNLITRSNWDRATVEALVGTATELSAGGMLTYDFPADFVNGDSVIRISSCLKALEKIGLDTDLITDLRGTVDATVSDAVKNATKAKYDELQWNKIAKRLRDGLREQQREALVAYTVFRPDSSNYEAWKDSNELYAYLLIDPEMKPISMTSRLKQAICSVQLFVDRVLLNFETDPTTSTVLALTPDQVEQWKEWRKVYRLWEANRKIFLYPENWLEPELRDDKTPFFKALESQLAQNELNEENVEQAFREYLERLDEVARLEIVGLYRQQEDEDLDAGEEAIDILHVIARTYTVPNKYFHRTLEDGEWTPWVKLDIDVDGHHIVPAIFNRRLCLFWLFFTGESIEDTEAVDPGLRYWKIQAAWSEFKNGRWTSKRLSQSYMESIRVEGKSEMNTIRQEIWVDHYIDSDKFNLQVNGDLFNEGVEDSSVMFQFNDTGNDPKVLGTTGLTSIYLYGANALDVEDYNQQQRAVTNGQQFSASFYSTSPDSWISTSETVPILDATPEGKFKLVLPSADYAPMQSEFFFQDTRHTFYVTYSPSEGTGIFVDPDTIGLPEYQGVLEEYWGPDDPIEDPVPSDPGIPFDPTDPEVFFGGLLDEEEWDQIPGMEDVGSVSGKMAGKANAALAKSSSTDTSRGVIWSPYKSLEPETQHTFLFETHYHDHVRTFIKELNKKGVQGLLKRPVQNQLDSIEFEDTYAPLAVVQPYPTSEIDLEFGSAYSQYNWELFFHAPMLIATRLSADQRFEEAMEWYHFIFNPTNSEGGGKERFWQFQKFYDQAGEEIETLNDLLADSVELEAQLAKWVEDPFQPHVIARMRITPYMMNVVMKYLDNLIGWGDQLFRRDTIESINEATNLYIMASNILGPRPEEIPPRAERADTTFDEIKGSLDAFSNVLVDIETFIAPSAAASGSDSSSLGQMDYFCVPRNEYLMKYWDLVEDRLFKIRNSMNIKGIVRTLPLFEPPIDPAMLVRAAAAGIDLSSILSDLSASLPQYRFQFLIQKANELTNEVKSLGGALLQALEKRDAEALSLLRQTHEQRLLDASLQIKKKQVDDTKTQLEVTKVSLENAANRKAYYASRPYMNAQETAQVKAMQSAMVLAAIQGSLSAVGGSLGAVPDFKIGSPFTMGASFGGSNLAAIMSAISQSVGVAAGVMSAQASMQGMLGGYVRRMDDWTFQADTASKDIEGLEKQVLSSEIKVAISEKELSNHEMNMEHSAEIDDFMRQKFSNEELYDWMIGQVSTVYFQTYQLAYDLAKQAQACYQYELGLYSDATFIQFGYWDSLKKGLLSAEKLQYDLRRMETSYYAENTREFELTRNVSLLMLDPSALLELRATGKCAIIVPEALFDFDFPGHYFRRIKSVSLSIPCIAGPYTPVSATLRLISHTTRISSDIGAGYESTDYGADTRFRHITTESHAIATSTGQNDSGMFELNFKDERYLPFEGCGAFGQWELTLNEDATLRQFDYETIGEVILHLKYTAKEDTMMVSEVKSYLNGLIALATSASSASASGMGLMRMLSMRHEFPGEWYQMFHPSSGSEQVLTFTLTENHFPFLAQGKTITVQSVTMLGLFDVVDDYVAELQVSGASTHQDFTLAAGTSFADNYADTKDVSAAGYTTGIYTLKVKTSTAADFTTLSEDAVRDIVLVLNYTL